MGTEHIQDKFRGGAGQAQPDLQPHGGAAPLRPAEPEHLNNILGPNKYEYILDR